MSLRPLINKKKKCQLQRHLIGVADRAPAFLTDKEGLCYPRRMMHEKAQHGRADWIPFPYRGAKSVPRFRKKVESSSPNPNSNHTFYFHKFKSSKTGDQTSSSNAAAFADAHRRMAARGRKRALLSLCDDLPRLANSYRRIFSTERPLGGVAARGRTKHAGVGGMKVRMRGFSETLNFLLDDIHFSDKPVQWEQIERSDYLYRRICMLLSDITIGAAALSRKEQAAAEEQDNSLDDSDLVAESLDLASVCFQNLAKLQTDRQLLVSSSKKWSSKSTTTAVPNDSKKEASGMVQSLKNWVFGLFENAPDGKEGDASKEQEQEQRAVSVKPKKTATKLAHNDPKIGPTQELFHVVIESISLAELPSLAEVPSQRKSFGGMNQQLHVSDASEKVRRMISVLGSKPSTWAASPESIDILLRTLARVGTLSSARTALHYFRQHPSYMRSIPFSEVLQAYLEATIRSTARNRQAIATEAFSELQNQWEIRPPRKPAEYFTQCATVLRILCEADQGPDQRMCDDATSLVKRTIGDDAYAWLIPRTSPKLSDSRILPMISSLANLYASSGDAQKLELAKRLVSVRMRQELVTDPIEFPLVKTFNAILRRLVAAYDVKSRENSDSNGALSDFEFAEKHVKYMLNGKDYSTWPDGETFQLMFRLLALVKPSPCGQRALSLLTVMEIWKSMSSTRRNIYISTYIHVLRCLLDDVKDNRDVTLNLHHAIMIWETLVLQSSPLVLGQRPLSSNPQLYDHQLKPTKSTFSVLLEICSKASLHDPTCKHAATQTTKKIKAQMIANGWTPTDDADLFTLCDEILQESG